jgi:hypothetical protein
VRFTLHLFFVELKTSRAKFNTQIKKLVQTCTYLFLRKLEWFWFWFLFHKKIGTLGPVLEKIIIQVPVLVLEIRPSSGSGFG